MQGPPARGPGASRGLQKWGCRLQKWPPAPGLQEPPGASGAGASRGLQGPPGALKGPELPATWVEACQGRALPARTPPGGPPRRSLKMWACQVEALRFGFRVFPSRGKSMYIVYIWPTGVAGGRAVPPDVREEPEGLYTSTLHRLLPLSYPVRV